MKKQPDLEIIDFVRKTTEAIVIISETTKSNKEISESIRDSMITNNTIAVANLQKIDGKIDGLLMMFKYVIVPLVTGILALVGVKSVFRL